MSWKQTKDAPFFVGYLNAVPKPLAVFALVFLELNTSPMFARFDAACGGALCRAMVEHLSTDA